MKKIISTVALLLVTFALLVNTIGIAWLSDNGMSSAINVEGNLHKSYFQSGDGSKDSPYEIATPVQLYYFSWLQYLGFFNQKGENNKIQTVYFKVSADLDMTDYTLPPIGTCDNPFLGNFDGGGHTISNLTVENEYDSLFVPPNDTEELTGAEIIGFFGVVGALEGETSYTYESSANQINDLILEKLTVSTQTQNALIGLVAGYVNGFVTKVGVVNSTVKIANDTQPLAAYGGNLSNYALIGYCTPDYKDDVFTVNFDLFNPSVNFYEVVPNQSIEGGGDGQGWGGSIAMDDMYEWIVNVRDNLATDYSNFVYERVDTKIDGKTITVHSKTAHKKVYYDSSLGAYVFSPRTTPDVYKEDDANFNYLSGSTEVTTVEIVKGEDGTAYYIKDGSNYLAVTGDYQNLSLTNTTSRENASKWIFSNGSNGGTAYTVINDSTINEFVCFLSTYEGKLTVLPAGTKKENDVWSVSDNGLSTGGKFIYCDNGVWKIDNGVKISRSGSYLTVSDSEVGGEGTEGSAVAWNFESPEGTEGKVFAIVDGTTYYLHYNGSLTLTTRESDAINWTLSGGKLSCKYGNGNRTYYLRYTNSRWQAGTNNSSNSLTIESVTHQLTKESTTATRYSYTATVTMDNNESNRTFDANGNEIITAGTNNAGITYYPLNFELDSSGNPTSTSNGNTGYIISSSGDRTASTSAGIKFPDRTGDIRVSRYGQNSMGTSRTRPYSMNYLHTTGFTQVPQIRSNTSITDTEKSNIETWGLNKYADCYGDYYSSTSSACYGLHFMDAQISLDSLITVNDVIIFGEEYDNYEMPTSCIDFNLKDSGFVNFVAGSYFSGNKAFFSLHKIERDQTTHKITAIKEIKLIYGKVVDNKIDFSQPYYYTYTNADPDVDVNSLGEGYQVIFDTAWITNPSAYSNFAEGRAFYFEVPVNAGEYALGSVAGRDGAYLVYLDLAANAQVIERTRVDEKTVTTESASSLPDGVSMLESKDSGTGNINPENSAFATIPSGAYGNSTFSQSGNVITDSATNHSAAYVAAGTELRDGEGALLTVPTSKVITVERTTYYDNNLVTKVQTLTVITKTTEAEGNQTTVTYTKDVTITDANGNETVKDTVTSTTALLPDVSDPKTNPPTVNVGTNPILSVQYIVPDTEKFAVEHEYSWESLTVQNSKVSVVKPTYTLTLVNEGEKDAAVVIAPTSAGVSAGISFAVNYGDKNLTFSGTTQKQTVTVSKPS